MSKLVFASTALAFVVVVLVSTAAAQVPTQDSARGAGSTNLFRDFAFSAHSGPQGENPSGTLILTGNTAQVRGDVVCLAVVGNRATLGVLPDPESFSNIPLLVTVVDKGGPGSGQDTLAAVAVGNPFDCSVPTENLIGNVTSGDIVVVDAPPLPTSKQQCKDGGWQSYGVFKNQGACVSFVRHQARQACIFERVAHGITAFRPKYGLGPNHDHAMRHCVRLRTGF